MHWVNVTDTASVEWQINLEHVRCIPMMGEGKMCVYLPDALKIELAIDPDGQMILDAISEEREFRLRQHG